MSKQVRVFVSGGTRGIGAAIAEAFLRTGATVAVCGRDQAQLGEAKRANPGVLGYIADVSRSEACAALAEQVEKDLGGLDVLVNNAGFFQPSALCENSDEEFDEMMRGNLYSAFYLTRAMVPMLRASSHATLINLCSVASIRGYPSGGAYAAAKHALLGATRSLREELKPDGIAVVALLPGATLTNSWAGTDLPEERFMRPEDVADVAVLAHAMSRRSVLEEVVMRPFLGDI